MAFFAFHDLVDVDASTDYVKGEEVGSCRCIYVHIYWLCCSSLSTVHPLLACSCTACSLDIFIPLQSVRKRSMSVRRTLVRGKHVSPLSRRDPRRGRSLFLTSRPLLVSRVLVSLAPVETVRNLRISLALAV